MLLAPMPRRLRRFRFHCEALGDLSKDHEPGVAGRLDPAHTEIYEKLAADIAHRRAVAGLQES
jgi:hypothetical protein